MLAKTPASTTRPQPGVVGRALGRLAKAIGKAIWKALWKTLFKILFKIVFGGALLTRWTLTGPRRHTFAPAWLYAAAAASWWQLPNAPWWWLTAAAALIASIHPPLTTWWDTREPVLSERERDLTGCTLAGIALVLDWAPHLGGRSTTAFLAAVVLAGAVPWWRGRRVREPDAPGHIWEWEEVIVPARPQLEGWWEPGQRDDVARTAVWRLASGKASDVVGLDADLEALTRRHPGTIVLSEDPRLTRDQIRIAWPSLTTASEYRFWDGPSLDPKTGLYVAGYEHGTNRLIYGRMFRPRGACHTAVVGGPGSGKGVFVRVWGMEIGLYKHARLYVADGSRGRGVPEIRLFATEYARTPTEWEVVVDRVYRIMLAREERYGEAGKSGWRPSPLEPLIGLGIDEGDTVMSSSLSIRIKYKHITARGRGVGIHALVDGQYATAAMYGSVDARENILANGTLWIGQLGGAQGRQAAKQDYQIDIAQLPIGPGWAFIGSKVVENQPPTPSRGPFIASQTEVDEAVEAGDEPPPTPFGVCEDWASRVVHAALHPDDAAAAAEAGPLCGTVPAVAEQESADGPGDAPHLSLVPAWAAPGGKPKELGIDRVRRILDEADRDMTVEEIADAADLVPRHVRDLLKRLTKETPPAAEHGDNGWRKAKKAS
jgi:hypothetical protein